MGTQIIIALCEGSHDVAFLNKIFKTIGFKTNEKSTLEEYPFPMNSLLIQEAKRTDVEGLNIQTIRQSLLPANALLKENVHILLYIMGGDGKIEKRKELVEKIKSTIVKPGEIRQGRNNQNITFGVAYFFDADDKGVQNRLNAVKDELKQVVPSILDEDFSANGAFGLYEEIKLGCYIFTNSENETGKLENILLPIMSETNEAIFDGANKFLDEFHDDNRLFPLKLQPDLSNITEERSKKAGDKYKYDRNKSLIGTIGQLQQSGGSNTVCIGFTDYLTLGKIQSNPKCQEILKFIDDFIKHTK